MATYYYATNNGVAAVMTEGAYQKLRERMDLIHEAEKKGLGSPNLPPVLPVFTFAQAEHRSFKYMTGSKELMNQLLGDHRTIPGNIWVPFSNGYELGAHGDEMRIHELQFMTNLDEALQAFSLDKVQVEQVLAKAVS